MKQEAQRGLNGEFDNFIDGLYAPIVAEAKSNTLTASGMCELDLPLSKLAEMYSESKVFQNAETMLATHGASMTKEAVEIASALVWLKKYGAENKVPQTDFLKIGQDRIVCYQDRVVEGLNLKIFNRKSGTSPEITTLSKKETSRSAAVFKLYELGGRGNYSTWRLESAMLFRQNKSGALDNLEVICAEGDTDFMTGTQFTLDIKNTKTAQSEKVASWAGRVDLKRSVSERKIPLTLLKNVSSPSGNWIVDIDVPYLSGARIYQRRAKAIHSAPVELDRYISEGATFGRGAAGVNIATEDGGEVLNSLSVSVDNFSRPGTVVNLDEYDITFKKDKKTGRAKRTRKAVELRHAKLFITTANKTEADSAKHFKTSLSEVIDPLISVLEVAQK